MNCPECNQALVPNARFCPHCGAAVPTPSPGVRIGGIAVEGHSMINIGQTAPSSRDGTGMSVQNVLTIVVIVLVIGVGVGWLIHTQLDAGEKTSASAAPTLLGYPTGSLTPTPDFDRAVTANARQIATSVIATLTGRATDAWTVPKLDITNTGEMGQVLAATLTTSPMSTPLPTPDFDATVAIEVDRAVAATLTRQPAPAPPPVPDLEATTAPEVKKIATAIAAAQTAQPPPIPTETHALALMEMPAFPLSPTTTPPPSSLCPDAVARSTVVTWSVGYIDKLTVWTYLGKFEDERNTGGGFAKGTPILPNVVIATDFGNGESEVWQKYPVKPIAHYRSWGLFEVTSSFLAPNEGSCITIVE